MNYFVYILKSINFPKTYVGFTNNLDRRLKEHNEGKSKFTSKYVPWKIIYTEIFSSTILAREREKYLKSAAGRKIIKAILNNTDHKGIPAQLSAGQGKELWFPKPQVVGSSR